MQISHHGFLVTGASSGLGAATAARLVANGGKVLLLDVNAQAGQDLAAQLGANAHFVQTDVTSADSVEAALAAFSSVFGAAQGLHGVINCAGVCPAEKVLGKKGVHALETFSRAIHINLIGSFNVLRLAAAKMAQNTPTDSGERGIIINTASVAAFDGQMGQAAYAASKGGIVAMTLPIARDLASTGIRVLAIAPGIMHTPMVAGMPQNVQDALGQMVPFPARLGKPDEYAHLVQHMIENAYLNGEVIRLDGAIRMAAK